MAEEYEQQHIQWIRQGVLDVFVGGRLCAMGKCDMWETPLVHIPSQFSKPSKVTCSCFITPPFPSRVLSQYGTSETPPLRGIACLCWIAYPLCTATVSE